MPSPTQDEEIKHILGHCLHPRDDEKDCIFWQMIGLAHRSKDEDKNRKIFENMQEAALHRLMLKERRDENLNWCERVSTLGQAIRRSQFIVRMGQLDSQIEGSKSDEST